MKIIYDIKEEMDIDPRPSIEQIEKVLRGFDGWNRAFPCFVMRLLGPYNLDEKKRKKAEESSDKAKWLIEIEANQPFADSVLKICLIKELEATEKLAFEEEILGAMIECLLQNSLWKKAIIDAAKETHRPERNEALVCLVKKSFPLFFLDPQVAAKKRRHLADFFALANQKISEWAIPAPRL